MITPDENNQPQDATPAQPAPPPDVDDDAWEGFDLDDTVFRTGTAAD